MLRKELDRVDNDRRRHIGRGRMKAHVPEGVVARDDLRWSGMHLAAPGVSATVPGWGRQEGLSLRAQSAALSVPGPRQEEAQLQLAGVRWSGPCGESVDFLRGGGGPALDGKGAGV